MNELIRPIVSQMAPFIEAPPEPRKGVPTVWRKHPLMPVGRIAPLFSVRPRPQTEKSADLWERPLV